MDQDKPYEERRGGSYVREADGALRKVAETAPAAWPEPPVIFARVETVYGAEPAPADEALLLAMAPADEDGVPLAPVPAAEPEKPGKSRKGR